MDTLIKIKDTPNGKALLAYLKSLNDVAVLGNPDDFISINILKKKVVKAEKSESISLKKAEQIARTWRRKC